MKKHTKQSPGAVVALALVLLAIVIGALIQKPPRFGVATVASVGLVLAAGWLASRRIRRRLDAGSRWTERRVVAPLEVAEMLVVIAAGLVGFGMLWWRLLRWLGTLP